MKLEKLTKDNIKEFTKDLNIDNNTLINDINKLEYYGVKEDDTFQIAFIVLPEDDRIAIKYISKKLSNDKFLNILEYLNKSIVVKAHLIIQIYDQKYIEILDNIYRCKDVYLSNTKEVQNDINSNLKEKYAEIDMYNIRYLQTKGKIICNLVKQNIQDETIINNLHEYFTNQSAESIDFISYESVSNILKELNYNCIYKSYVIEE